MRKKDKKVSDEFVYPAKGTDAEKARYWLGMFERMVKQHPEPLKMLVDAVRKPDEVNHDLKSKKSLRPFLEEDGTVKSSVSELIKKCYPNKEKAFLDGKSETQKRLYHSKISYNRRTARNGVSREDRNTMFLRDVKRYCERLEEKHGRDGGAPTQKPDDPDSQPK